MTNFKPGEFPCDPFGGGTGLGKMAFHRFIDMLWLGIIKSKLDGFVTINLLYPDLGYHTGTGFDDRTGNIFPVRIEDAGHTYFLSN